MFRAPISLCLMMAMTTLAAAGPILRRPIGPDRYYPAEPQALLDAVQAAYAAEPAAQSAGKLAAVIVPHSPYKYTAPTLAAAFAPLERGQFDRVVILGPSHFSQFEGCSIPEVDAFVTPLGAVPVDAEATNLLNYSSLITIHRLRYGRGAGGSEALHEAEHSIEAILPFLQVRLGEFRLVPILTGALKDAKGAFDPAAAAAIADRIRPLLDGKTLLVASSDFTHFGNTFRYLPFADKSPERIKDLDREAIAAITAMDAPAFARYVEDTESTICGQIPILIAMAAVAPHCLPVLVDHRLSAEVNSDYDQSIGFAGVQFYDFGRPVRPEATKEAKKAGKQIKASVVMTNIPNGGSPENQPAPRIETLNSNEDNPSAAGPPRNQPPIPALARQHAAFMAQGAGPAAPAPAEDRPPVAASPQPPPPAPAAAPAPPPPPPAPAPAKPAAPLPAIPASALANALPREGGGGAAVSALPEAGRPGGRLLTNLPHSGEAAESGHGQP